ncbi:nucleotide sugar dehydrogenase [Candidatus Micrarchaeota archaeon]|nr:nucleotide sugar dehydrogenase [Candidatus Micrarchaeota archaeon]
MKVYSRKKTEIVKALRRGDITFSVYGIGKMGLPLAVILADKGARVIGVGRNMEIINKLNRGICDIDEPGLSELVKKTVKAGRFSATNDAIGASRQSDVKIILVPTLLDEENNPDLEAVKSVSKSIAAGLHKGDLVILESTAPPGTTENVIKPILEKSGLRAGRDFGLAHCPERTSSGRAIIDILGAYPKIVGGIDRKSSEACEAIYSVVNKKGVIVVKNLKTAEAVKVVEGIYRDVNIALANQLAVIFDELGVDSYEAFLTANTQPYSNMHMPGTGVGGHCIPVYPYFITKITNGDASLLKLAREVNDSMANYTVSLAESALTEAGRSIKVAKIMVLGIAFRGGVKETRYSPSFRIIKLLREKGADVHAYDPLFTKQEIEKMGFSYSDKFNGMDCIIIVSDHKEFRKYNWRKVGKEMRNKVLIDGRNVVEPSRIIKLGFIYKGIGHA